MPVKIMLRPRKAWWALLLLLLFCFLLDGSMELLLFYALGGAQYEITPAIFLLALFFLAADRQHLGQLYLLALFFGFLYDIYYSRLFGLCLFLFPFLVFIIQNLFKPLRFNFFNRWFLALVLYGLYSSLVFLIYNLLGLAGQSGALFFWQNLLPSLIFNMLVAFVLNGFIRRFNNWLAGA